MKLIWNFLVFYQVHFSGIPFKTETLDSDWRQLILRQTQTKKQVFRLEKVSIFTNCLDNLFLYSNINKNYRSYSSFRLIIIPLRNFCVYRFTSLLNLLTFFRGSPLRVFRITSIKQIYLCASQENYSIVVASLHGTAEVAFRWGRRWACSNYFIYGKYVRSGQEKSESVEKNESTLIKCYHIRQLNDHSLSAMMIYCDTKRNVFCTQFSSHQVDNRLLLHQQNKKSSNVWINYSLGKSRKRLRQLICVI
jgi:hypothetical protein